MTTEKFIHLIKTYSYSNSPDKEPNLGETKINSVVNICQQSKRDASIFDGVVAYLKDQIRKEWNGIRLQLTLGREPESHTLDLHIKNSFMERACQALQNPFIRVKGRIQKKRAKTGRISFDRRYNLQDKLNTVDKMNSSHAILDGITFPTLSKGEILVCEMSMYWVEIIVVPVKAPPKPKVKAPAPAQPKMLPPTQPEVITDKGTLPLQVNPATFLKNLFQMEESKDVTIVAGNGAELSCHTLIFQAHSPALAKMVRSIKWTKAFHQVQALARIEMKELSEAGLGHFLKYLYCFDLATQEMPCKVAVELFQAACKYHLPQLENGLRDLFLQKEVAWFTPEDILELYLYTRSLKGYENMRDHAVRIMASMNINVLRSCARFQEVDSPEIGMMIGKLVRLLKKDFTTTNEFSEYISYY